ncbi:three-Cys-motif partner protein TcmP [Candidatus Poribacteria bacterium]|nr:three-Cys-motif partner protein TcmP [Candidatus Poribacteria bacterium]
MTNYPDGSNDESWDISKRPHTREKLEILRKCFDVWLTIWNGILRKQNWVAKNWYVIDLFAGRGYYSDRGSEISGSPLIFLEEIAQKADRLEPGLHINLFFIEGKQSNYDILRYRIDKIIKDNPQLIDIVRISCYNEDCNNHVDEVIRQITNSSKNPIFTFIDPYGIKIRRNTVEKLVRLRNPKDIILNYMLEGIRRTTGIAKKVYGGFDVSSQEKKSVDTLLEFIGEDIDIVDTEGNRILDVDLLQDYVDAVFISHNLEVVVYDMKYPSRNDIIYYLLFACKNEKVANVVHDIYARQKRNQSEPLLPIFGEDYYRDSIMRFAKISRNRR